MVFAFIVTLHVLPAPGVQPDQTGDDPADGEALRTTEFTDSNSVQTPDVVPSEAILQLMLLPPVTEPALPAAPATVRVYTPVPLKLTFSTGELYALDVMTSVVDFGPAEVGVNVTFNVQF